MSPKPNPNPQQPQQQPAQNKFQANTTNKAFSFGNKTYGLNQNTQLIKEDETLSQLKEKAEKDKPEYGQAINIILNLNDIVQNYNKKMKPLDGADAFEKKLVELEDDTQRAIVHTIMALAREIDHGNEIKAEYQDKLNNFSNNFSNKHMLPSDFLKKYVETLKKRESNITQSIQSFTDYLDTPSSLQSPQMLRDVIKQQHEAIVRCSARISQIKYNSDQIQEKMAKIYKKSSLTSINNENGTEQSSFSKTIMEDYDKFKKDKDRNLQKRNPDKERWKKPQQTTNGFGQSRFNFGNKTTGFGTQNKTTGFGTQNKTTGFGTQNKTAGFGTQNAGAGTANQNAGK